jgi:hypothetical protein
MLARPSRIGETIASGVTHRILEDAHLIDKMGRAGTLVGRPLEAAGKLLEMAEAAGKLPGATAALWRVGKSSEMSDAMAEAEAAWRQAFNQIPGHRAELVRNLILGQGVNVPYLGVHPGVRWLATVQAALDDLGEWWGMPV